MENELENVAKTDEEEAVKDTDADTRDIVDAEKEQENDNYESMRKFMDEMRSRMDAIDETIRSIKDAQAVTIDNGAVIRDDSEPDSDVDYVDTRTIAELDLSI